MERNVEGCEIAANYSAKKKTGERRLANTKAPLHILVNKLTQLPMVFTILSIQVKGVAS